jgi:hypothetical protein
MADYKPICKFIEIYKLDNKAYPLLFYIFLIRNWIICNVLGKLEMFLCDWYVASNLLYFKDVAISINKFLTLIN